MDCTKNLFRLLERKPVICSAKSLPGPVKAHASPSYHVLLDNTQNQGFNKPSPSACGCSHACGSPSNNDPIHSLYGKDFLSMGYSVPPLMPKNSLPSSITSDITAPKTVSNIDFTLSLSLSSMNKVDGLIDADRSGELLNSNKVKMNQLHIKSIDKAETSTRRKGKEIKSQHVIIDNSGRAGTSKQKGNRIKLEPTEIYEQNSMASRKGKEIKSEHVIIENGDRKQKGKRIKLEPTESYEHNSMASKTYACKICEKSFNSFQALGGHSAGHSKQKRKPQIFEEKGDGNKGIPIKFEFDLNKLPDMGLQGDGSKTNPILLD